MSAPFYYLEGDFEKFVDAFAQREHVSRAFEKDGVLIKPHLAWDKIMYIESGIVKASIVQSDREKLLAFYGKGYIIPYYAPEDVPVANLIQFTAVEKTSVMVIDRADFELMLTESSEMRKAVYEMSWRLVHLLVHEVESQSFDTGIEKVATFIYTFYERTGRHSMKLSASNLQSFVGLNRTNLNKYLAVLAAEHIIQREHGVINITAPEKLRAYCSERVINCDVVSAEEVEHGRISEDKMLEAVRKRDESFDGVFWYGVKSTGVFCNPSCKSKMPLVKNIDFFQSPKEAMQAGYRICKRCRPDLSSFNPDRELAAKVKEFIDEHFDDGSDLNEFIGGLYMDSGRVSRLFRLQYEVSPRGYIQARRLEKAAGLLANTEMNVLEVAMSSGFSSLSNFYSVFRRIYDMTPVEYRRIGNFSGHNV